MKKQFPVILTLLLCLFVTGCAAENLERNLSGSSAPEPSAAPLAASSSDVAEHTYQGVTFSLNSRCEETAPAGTPPYRFVDKQTGAAYMMLVHPGTDKEIMTGFAEIIGELRFEKGFDGFQFAIVPDDYAELTTQAGDRYHYNIMTVRYQDGHGNHVATVCSGKVLVSIFSDFQKKGDEKRALAEIERILQRLHIDEEQALQSFLSPDGEDLQTVGNDSVGYVSVPSTWVKFLDLDGGTDFQYSNATGTEIITMNVFDTTGLSAEQLAALNAEMAARSIWVNLESEDVTNITGATVTLNRFDAYQVYGIFKSEDHGILSCIVCWIFEDEQGVLHYVSAEAPIETMVDVVSYVEDSFTLESK